MGMEVTFWGVRGSIPTPGPETVLVGGNTSCVEVECGETRIVLDAGTGLRGLGEALALTQEPVDVTILLSHLHWDHIQGLPFFVPAYRRTTRLEIFGPATEQLSLPEVLGQQMRSPVFPVPLAELPARVSLEHVRAGERLRVGSADVMARKLNHPGGVFGYRIDYDRRSLVYATDTEHYACLDPTLLELAKDANILIYDAQYLPEEYRGETGGGRVGWGHSTYEAATELARVAHVERCVLFHHDPHRTDEAVLEIEHRAALLFGGVVAAREGLRLDGQGVARTA